MEKESIIVNNISKKYYIVDGGGKKDFWALKNITFSVENGESIGVIGKNGSGKSTLLKIIANVVSPTEGYVDVYGRVGSMLELGAGFHPELTGRENVILSGVILGLSRKEIDKIYNNIVDFSELSQFMDLPLKYYSSGMHTRLAFSVSSHINADILLIDEVLSVGDFEFQKKCIDRIKSLSKLGKTILFVSHDMSAVSDLCTKCLYIANGKTMKFGESSDVIKEYLKS